MEQFDGLHIYDLQIWPLRGFSFIMPEHEVDRSDLMMNVLVYTPTDPNDHRYTMQIWAYPKEKKVSFFCHGNSNLPESIATAPEDELLAYLNGNDEFLEDAKRLSDWLTQNGQ